MKFWEAMKIIEEGGAVRRPHWIKGRVMKLLLTNTRILVDINLLTNRQDFCTLDMDDLMAEDWIEEKTNLKIKDAIESKDENCLIEALLMFEEVKKMFPFTEENLK